MTHYFVWVMNEQHQKNIFLNIKNNRKKTVATVVDYILGMVCGYCTIIYF